MHATMLIVLFAAFWFGFFKLYIVFFMAIFFHELGHISALYFMGIRRLKLIIYPIGCRLDVQCYVSMKQQAYAALWGPLTSAVLAFACYLLIPIWQPLYFFMLPNIVLAVINLLPAMPLDGGRISFICLYYIKGFKTARKVLRLSGVIVGIIISLIGVLALCLTRFNFTIMLFGLFLCYYALFIIKKDVE